MNTTSIVMYAILALILAAAFYLAPVAAPISGGFTAIKYAIYAVLALFTGYTVYCSTRENFFKSVKKMNQLHWGRQVGIDLYIGLLLQGFLIYLNEKSIAVAIVWMVPTLIYGNIIPFAYFATHFESIVHAFMLSSTL